tara:strand:+ start:1836 stop:2105 length:270 start_codon:yes stop_codon:yes gene_type:complete
MKHIVKRRGHEELFDERKVYASCYSACLSSHIKRVDAEKICEKVTKEIKSWIKDKKKVTSPGISRQIVVAMRKYSKDASFMYESHKDIS